MVAGQRALSGRLQGYGSPEEHEAVSRMIRRHSSNPQDIRELALAGRDLSGVLRVLDLGCGFGFLAEVLAPRLPAEARVTGIDACAANREPFLSRLAAAGREGEFVHLEVEQQLPWPDDSFDLVVSSYSLYYFPSILPELTRILKAEGRLLALTHQESAVAAWLSAAGLSPDSGPLMDTIRRFSSESATALLTPWFSCLERRDYSNQLVFSPGHEDELFAYLRFKLRLMVECDDGDRQPCAWWEQGLRERLAQRLDEGGLRLPKDDSFFWANTPLKGRMT